MRHAREGDQPHPVPLQALTDRLDQDARRDQPVRAQIARRHRAAGVNSDQHVQPAPRNDRGFGRALELRKTQDRQHERAGG